MEDDNEIITKDDILKAISFNGGISGTTAAIVDAEDIFGKRALKRNKYKTITGARETHRSCCKKD